MKRFLLSVAFALITGLAAMAQQAEMIFFAGEVTVPKVRKSELYQRMLLWCQDNTPHEGLKNADEETGELKGTSFLPYTSNVHAASDLTQGYVLYDFKVVATETGFRYMLTNFRHEAKIKFHTITAASGFPYKISTVEKPWYDLVWKDIKQNLNQQVPRMMAELKAATQNPSYAVRSKDKIREDAIFQLLNKGGSK